MKQKGLTQGLAHTKSSHTESHHDCCRREVGLGNKSRATARKSPTRTLEACMEQDAGFSKAGPRWSP